MGAQGSGRGAVFTFGCVDDVLRQEAMVGFRVEVIDDRGHAAAVSWGVDGRGDGGCVHGLCGGEGQSGLRESWRRRAQTPRRRGRGRRRLCRSGRGNGDYRGRILAWHRGLASRSPRRRTWGCGCGGLERFEWMK